MGKCFVRNCNSGYKSCKEKFSLFKPPADAEKLAAWRRAISRKDRVLTRKDLVCERHFASHFVVKTWSAEYNGHILMQGERRATLAKDAVPSIFEGCPAYLTKEVKPSRKPLKRKANTSELPAKSRRLSPGNGECTHSAANALDNPPEGDDNTLDLTENRTGTVELRPSAFDVLFESAQSSRLPESSWAVHRVDVEGIRDIVYSKMAVKQDSGATNLYIAKAVHIKSDMSVNIVLLGKSLKPVSAAVSASVTTLSDVEQVVNAVEAIKVCSGGPSIKEYPKAEPECAYGDFLGKWRHSRCTIAVAEGGVCKACSSLCDTLRIHTSRQVARKKERRVLQRIRIPVQSKERGKIETLRRAKTSLTRSKARLLARNKVLLMELNQSKDKMKSLQNEDLQHRLQQHDIPSAQLLLISECIAAAKCTNKRNRRYTDDWLLLCLLLHIRSSSTYSFLRNNDILPLPCVTTIRKYVSMMGLKCGFDERCLAALATKMATKSPMERRGMLVLDEIQVRKELVVNSKTMTYSRLVDHGQDDKDCKELADHGLVFAFAPFADSYIQPVALFASKGPTKGTVLSQLLLQCILKLEQAGIRIDGVVCDGASTNRSMWKHFGVSGVLGGTTNSFEHPSDSS
ncbi:hypothetical protein HPB48_003447 [Haemaphysalis longicornis]|uniref:THAP-type domain-containing protein n=1 Tax=Haemaphysalis longicornis TaxID=44386 RepID=A0A9J6GCS5_HAELO|nr:hypothetical protein HPB48_003447 [Haemaphysalis longicornis]